MTLADALLADFREESALSRTLLAAVPDEHFAWKPHEKSCAYSLAQLASHIAETPVWTSSMLEGDLDFASPEAAEYRPFVASNTEELLEAFERNAEGFRAALTGREDAFLGETWTMRNGDKVLMSAPRHGALRSIVLHHTAHHRGQLSVYLRLLDVPVPPTYGPTADTPDFMG